MPVPTGTSCLIAAGSALLIFSGMQMYKPWLISSQLHTIFGGYLGSLFFVMFLTAVGNLESCVFGRAFQMKIFPEVAFCLVTALILSGTIHRVCATSCLLLSIVSLYYMSKHSQRVYMPQAKTASVVVGKKRK